MKGMESDNAGFYEGRAALVANKGKSERWSNLGLSAKKGSIELSETVQSNLKGSSTHHPA